MRILSLIGITLLIFILVPLFYDNRDHTVRKENEFVITSNTRLLIQNIIKLGRSIKEEVEKKKIQEQLKLQELMQVTKNVCINGKDPQELTNQEKVNEFINGPCAPVILVPGLAGTSLQIVIDCEKLQLESPEIFEACGWGTCNAWEFWYSRPDSEYRLWISTTTSKVGIIQTSPDDHCFGSFIELQYDDAKNQHQETPGVKLTYYGNTPTTSSNAECGLTGISNMTDDYLIMYMMCDYKGFAGIGDLLKNMGYVSGLTFQPIPYDYRKGISVSGSWRPIYDSLINNYQITGKKSIIITHSLGSLLTLNVLSFLTQQDKDEYIATLFTMGAPYIGSSKALRAQLGGDPSYLDSFLGLTVGINYWNQNKAINSASSQIDLYPRDAFFRFKDEPWMKDLQNRILQEKEFLITGINNVTAVSWFPSPSNNCTNITARKPNCLMNLQYLEEHLFEIQGQKARDYTVNGTKINHFYLDGHLYELETLKNPGVPSLILYGSYSSTEYQFKYQKNPRDQVTSTGDFYFPEETTTTLGDSTVITSSAVTPAVKWIYEHNNGISKNPVKLVEFCSFYNSGSSVYDRIENGQKTFTQSGYFGLKCECLLSPSESNNIYLGYYKLQTFLVCVLIGIKWIKVSIYRNTIQYIQNRGPCKQMSQPPLFEMINKACQSNRQSE